MENKKGEDFRNSLTLPKIALQLSGIEIFPKNASRNVVSFIQSWLFYFNIFWTYPERVGELYGFIDGIRTGKTFDELSIIIPRSMVAFMAIAKSHPLYFNRHTVKDIIEKLRTIHPDEHNEDLDIDNANIDKDVIRKILKEEMKFLNMVVMLLYYLSAIVFIMFDFTPLLSMAYDYYKSGTTEFKLPFLIKYFFDPSTLSTWPIAYIHQVGSSFIACINVFGSDSLLYAFCTYLQMHFRLLCHHFENVVIETNMAETRNSFRKAVKRHQELIELAEQIQMLYSKSTLCNVLSSSLAICLSGFNIMFIDDMGIVCSYIAFLIMSLSQIFLLCYFGDILSTSSAEIYQAVYRCKWYYADQDIRRSVLLVMIRFKSYMILAQRPCKLTAMNFVDLNLPAFTTILSRSWSYFALLKTMFD